MLRGAHLWVPAVTVALSAALLLRGQPREVLGARVYSGPSQGAGPASMLIVCVRSDVGVQDRVAHLPLRVQVDHTVSEVACDDDGVVEVPFVRGPDAPIVMVSSGREALLLGTLDVAPRAWRVGHAVAASTFRVMGDVAGKLVIPAGVLPTEVESKVVFVPEAPGAVRVSATAFEVRGLEASEKETRFSLVPRFSRSEVTFERDGKRSSVDLTADPAEVILSDVVVTGGEVRARIQRRGAGARAHVVLADEEARRAARTVRLTRTPTGDGAGEVTFSLDGVRGPAWLEAGPDAVSPRTTSFPIFADRAGDGRVTRDVPALSSVESRRAHEGGRQRSVMQMAFALLVAGATAEILLVLSRLRAARRDLDAHLAKAGAPEAVERRGLLDAVVLVAMLAFGFAVIAAVFTYRR